MIKKGEVENHTNRVGSNPKQSKMKTLNLNKMEKLTAISFWGCAAGLALLIVGTATLNPVVGGAGIVVMALECHN